MNTTDIAQIRLASQQIAKTNFNTPKEIVNWLGAMQAQDYAMVKWAIGTRLPHSTEQSIESAIDEGAILRTHLLRPTWHFVSSDDIYWMLELSAPQIKTSLRSRHKQLEIDENVIKKSNDVIVKALSAGQHLTRIELVAEFEKSNIPLGDNRASHLLMFAEMEGLICSGVNKGNKQTYALLQERVPSKTSLKRDEALARLAKKYFSSHSPATLEDFIWWSGLSKTDASQALNSIKSGLYSKNIDSQTYWFSDAYSTPSKINEAVHLLPAFDEYVISYKDRSAVLSQEHHKKAVSNNGIFWPIIVKNGRVIGSWKRTIKKNKVLIDISPFQSLNKAAIKAIENKIKSFGDFLGKEATLLDKSV